jgi:hypothetical protein
MEGRMEEGEGEAGRGDLLRPLLELVVEVAGLHHLTTRRRGDEMAMR